MKPTLSKSALILSGCTAWMQPGAKHYDDEYADTTKRDKGTLFHRLMDQYIKTGSWDAGEVPAGWSDVLVWMRQATVHFESCIRPRAQWVMSEVAFGVNFTAEHSVIHMDVEDRNYPDLPGYINGTADLVWLRDDGVLVVQDWKTGAPGGAKEQLLSLTLGYLWTLPDEDQNARAYAGFVNEALVVNEAGVWPEAYDVRADALFDHAVGMMYALGSAIKSSEAAPVPGAHCTALYCPHLAFCPAISSLVDEAAEAAEPKGPVVIPTERLTQRYRMTAKPSSDDEAGYVMARVSACKRQVAYLEEALKAYCGKGGRVISGEWEWSKKNDGFRWRRR